MASAFSVFRKNEKWMMAIIGVMAMIAFVFVSPLNFGRGSSGDDPVVAETTLYGNIRLSDVKRMQQARAMANLFAYHARRPLERLTGQGASPQTFGNDRRESVVQTMLLARKAEQMGMRVTDDEITRFLQQDLTMNVLTKEQFSEIFAEVAKNWKGFSHRQLYDALRPELLASSLQRLLAAPQQFTPAQRWEAYERLNNRARISAVALAVEDYLPKVAEPSDAEVSEMYQKYKDREPDPRFPTPGFRMPAKVTLQYFKAEFEQFNDPSQVTYGEIVSYYDRAKDPNYLYSGDFGAGLDDAKPDESDKEKSDADKKDASGDTDATSKGGGCEGEEAKAPEKPEPKNLAIKDDLILPRDLEAPRFDPLWKVESQIREELARQKAVERMDEVLGKLRQKMVAYGSAWSRWEGKHEVDSTLPPPKQLDFEALATENHVAAHLTPPLTQFALSTTEGLGMSYVESRNAAFAAVAFQRWQLYQALISTDVSHNRYLVWKIDEQPARLPPLAEIRDDVVRACKIEKARKLALDHAKELADLCRTDKKPLADIAARDELAVIRPEPFSWLTFGAAPQLGMPREAELSPVQSIPEAGNEFMSAVFGQSVGDITTALNQPQTIVYVIQLDDFEPGADVMHASFLAENIRTYGQLLRPLQEMQQRIWFNSIFNEAGLKWTTPPDSRGGSPDEESADD